MLHFVFERIVLGPGYRPCSAQHIKVSASVGVLNATHVPSVSGSHVQDSALGPVWVGPFSAFPLGWKWKYQVSLMNLSRLLLVFCQHRD